MAGENNKMNEDTLEQGCLEWLAGLGYECVHGDDLSLGGSGEIRNRYSDVVLGSYLRRAIGRLNPDLSAFQLEVVATKVASYGSQSLIDGNKEVYDWLRNGVPLEVTEEDGRRTVRRVAVIDFAGRNELMAVRQLTIHGNKIRRPDIILFVNGLPLVVIELKNPASLNADYEGAYNQIQT